MAKRDYFRITDLSGGLNLDTNALLVADNEAVEIRNFRLDKLGSLVSRQGYSRYNSASPGSVLSLGRWRNPTDPSQNVVLVALGDGSLSGVVSGSWTELLTGLDTTAVGEFVPVRDITIYANGVDSPVAFDGTTAYTLGIAAPASAPSLAATTGTLTGTYKYTYTYYSSTRGVESNAADTSPITLAAEGTDVSLVASSDSTVDKIRVYRTTAGGATPLLLDETTNVTATYTDDGSGSLTLTAAPSTNDAPPALEHVAYLQGYTFGSIDGTLCWSKAYQPDYWPALFSTEVPFEGNDTIVALWAHQDTLLIFGRQNVILLSGGSGEWRLSRVDVDQGVVNSNSILEVDGSLVFLAKDGLRLFPNMQPFAPKLTRTLAQHTRDELEAAACVYVPEERSIWISVADRTYTVHIPNQAVSRYTFHTSQFLAGGDTGFELPLFIDSDSGFINQYGGTYLDLGESIPVMWRSKVYALADPELTKFFRRIGAFASTGSTSTITITITDRGAQSVTVPLDSVSAGNQITWDNFDWDEAMWSSEGVSYFLAALPANSLFGRTIQVTISGFVSGETEVVSPVTFEYRTANRFLGV